MISNIRKLRVLQGYTRPELAEKVGVSWETIKAYEVKGAFPSLKVAYKLAKELEVSVEALYDFEEEMK